jgi:RNA polymerase sigma-70 factor (ECF subfamily)
MHNSAKDDAVVGFGVVDGAAAPSDQALVESIRAGDLDAFESLFRAYWDGLYRFAFRYLGSADDAEEAVQTVFTRIWRNREGWRVRGTIQDYLYLATRNASRDRLKHESIARRWRERSVGELRSGAGDITDADRILNVSEIELAIERALAELPAKRRRICELRLGDDLSYAEIASQLGISTKTVETQIARSLKFLRQRCRKLLD